MDKNYTHITDDLVVKYLLGEANATETISIEEWANSHPDHQKKLEDYRTILIKSEFRLHDIQVDEHQALERLNQRLERERKIKKPVRILLLRWAAVVAIFLTIGWLAYFNLSNKELKVATANQILTQVLPDGSTAILNKQTSLSFKGGAFSKNRAVQLKGEAFFKVSANKSKPFIIQVNNVQVTVVGTAFNVSGKGNKTVVNVESGIVRVSHHGDDLRLTAGEGVVVAENQSKLYKTEIRGKLYNYYYSGELICDGTPLSDLIPVLNEKFNANIVIVNPNLRALPISTTFKNESLREILLVISETFKIKVTYGKESIKLN